MSLFDDASRSPAAQDTARAPRGRGRDYWDDVAHVQASDAGARSQTGLRYAIVIGAGLPLYLATWDVVYLLWAAVYVCANMAYSRVLRRTAAPVSLHRYLGLVGLKIVTSSIYAAVPIYLWLSAEDQSLRALALCGLAGHAMFNLARHSRRTLACYWDTAVTLGSVAIFGLTEVLAAPGLVGQVCIGFGTAALMLFYAQAQMVTIRDREALASSRDAIVEAQKQSTMAQITAGVAHDFNNKLTVIQGNIELAALTHDPAERAALLREARLAGEKAAEVVAHMQAFVRKSPLRVSRIDLTRLGEELSHAAQGYVPDTMQIALHIDEGVGEMACDAGLLHTALLNLVLNARDAMEGHGGRIELRIAPGDLGNWSGRTPNARGPYLRFDVTDEGPGLPVEAFHRVQEPFYSSKPRGMGTGLGLSMVKGFAEQIGGAMMLRNRPGGGLQVSLILPRSISG